MNTVPLTQVLNNALIMILEGTFAKIPGKDIVLVIQQLQGKIQEEKQKEAGKEQAEPPVLGG